MKVLRRGLVIRVRRVSTGQLEALRRLGYIVVVV